MPLPRSTIPEDERRALTIQAALDSAIKIMAEQGLDASAIVGELLGRCVLGLWCGGEDRIALRAKACTAITAHVDGLFDTIGDEDAPAIVDFDAFVRDAIQAAPRIPVGTDAEPDDPQGEAWAAMPIDESSRPVVRALTRAGVGHFDPETAGYIVPAEQLCVVPATGLPLIYAGTMVELFAAEIRKSGATVYQVTKTLPRPTAPTTAAVN